MAKKGAAAQLQAELNSDEDFEKFLERYPDALLVLDVYSDWCGPCLGAINALRKIKMELGGDLLQLAIVKCDNITKLQRFYKKSEPSWLFLRRGKSVNLMFGSNVPKLMDVIRIELGYVDIPVERRPYVEIDQLHPEEQRREQIKNDRLAAIALKERLEREKKRRDYLMFCTNAILENLPEIGVTVFGPQVNRDMFKKINAPAEELKLACKDKRYQYVTKEDFQTVNFACAHPLPDDVIEELTKQEILICFWKIPEDGDGNVPRAMQQYIHELTKRTVEPPDEYNSEERVTPAIIEPMKIKVLYEVDDNVICPPEEVEEEQPKEKKVSIKPSATEDEIETEADGEEEDEGEGREDQAPAEPAFDMPLEFDMGELEGSQQGEEEESSGPVSDGPPPKKICTKTVKMPAVWSPNDERTQAALIYVFFRAQTLPFLLPDPPPEPPHVVMAFDTYKKRDLISIAERNKDEIPMYGFFTSDEADEAKFIANSAQKYAHQPASANDKLVFKVNKRTSHMMLSLASYGATYVSPNTNIGKEEALKFFPEGYKTAEQERLEALEAQKKAAAEEKKDGKDKKSEAAPSEPEPVPEIELEGFDVDDFADMVEAMEGEGDIGEGYGAEGEGGFVGAEGEGGEMGEEEFDAVLEAEAIEVE